MSEREQVLRDAIVDLLQQIDNVSLCSDMHEIHEWLDLERVKRALEDKD